MNESMISKNSWDLRAKRTVMKS